MALANMVGPESWLDREAVAKHLAGQLARGRLSLFLGAGVSGFYGLPEWNDLVTKLCTLHGQPAVKAGDDVIVKAAALRSKFYKDDTPRFLTDVKRELFAGAAVDFEKLRANRQLAAIGALVMASKRGSASQVVTFNYDDLLELYLEYHGLVAASISSERHWHADADVTIYHPHGLLALKPDAYRTDSDDIVLGTQDYFNIMNGASQWRTTLLSILRTHTTIYIGLSGKDMHLQALLADLKTSHVSLDDRQAYHGVRFAVGPADDIGVVLDDFGVATLELSTWDDLATFLFEIVQVAREVRMARA